MYGNENSVPQNRLRINGVPRNVVVSPERHANVYANFESDLRQSVAAIQKQSLSGATNPYATRLNHDVIVDRLPPVSRCK